MIQILVFILSGFELVVLGGVLTCSQVDVMRLATSCRFLRQDHALGLNRLIFPAHFEGHEDADLLVPLPPAKAMPAVPLKEIMYKFRYAQSLVMGRAMRLHDVDFEQLKISQLRCLDLSFCRKISAEKFLAALRECFCLQELCLRGCTQLSSPDFEETLGLLKSLAYLDLRGCEQLKTDSVAKQVAAELKSLHTLRFGFECQEKLWPFGAQIPMMSLNLSSWNFASMNLRFLELDLEFQQGLTVTHKDVKALLSMKTLDSLMLWNPTWCLSAESFHAIVSYFQNRIDAFVLEDCYHQVTSYFHVLPSSWPVYNRFTLEDFTAEGLLPHGPQGKRRVLCGVNVSRDPSQQIATMATPVADLCEVGMDGPGSNESKLFSEIGFFTT